MSKGCDHSNGGVHIGGGLKAAGFVGAFRYAAAGRGDVNISASEYQDLKAHGIDVAIVNEHSAAYLLGGYNTGRDTSLGARDVTRAAGIPDGVVYMGGDSESLQQSGGNLAAVAAAMRGCGDAIGRDNAGFYGSYYVVDYLVRSEPWIKYYWQTVAWSNGRLHPRANAYQHASTSWVGGVELDNDDLLKPDWGQRGLTHPIPPLPEDTVSIAAATNKDGTLEAFVHLATGEVKHTWQENPGGHWIGVDPNKPDPKQVAWTSLGNPGKP